MRLLGQIALADAVQNVWRYLHAPVPATPWADWRGFWLGQIADDRFVVLWFLPLLPILLLVPRQRLRLAIVLTGLAFMVYVFGALYALFWVATCVGFYFLSERYERECRRTDVLPIGPPLVAGLLIGVWYVGTMLLHRCSLPTPANEWLYQHLRWIYPLGVRGWAWEPQLLELNAVRGTPGAAPPLVFALFWNIHNIGAAYLVVRMLHYFSELKRNTIPVARRSLLSFLAYVCYAPAVMQGPIERYLPFQDELDTCHERRGLVQVPRALVRIGLGLLKSLVATWYLVPLLQEGLGHAHGDTYYKHPEQIGSFWLLYFGVAFDLLYLYLEFSGYCDVSAGIARLLGYRQVENFDRPYLATSMRDLWRRWHISLSLILRDYIYIPLGGNRRHVTLNLCITFTLCGIWHQLSTQVALWGLIMGLMVAVHQHWVHWLKRLDERQESPLARLRRAWLRLRPLPTICAWLLTQHAFMFSLLVLFGGSGIWRVPREIIRRIWSWLV
jgi:hypothetical protein